MKFINYRVHHSQSLICLLLAFSIIMLGCKEKKETNTVVENEPPPGKVEILTEVMDFQMQDTLPAGWLNLNYKNASQETHFVLFEKYPEGKTIEDGKKEVFPVFQEGMNYLNEGNPDGAMEAYGKLPEWFSQVEFRGGTGLISPGSTANSTIKLDPGYYLVECYVKMSNGKFHSVMGMSKGVIVDSTANDLQPPKPTVRISISSSEGIVLQDSIQAGRQIFSVDFKDQKVYENFVGHDINLVRLEPEAQPEALEKWMNWSDPEGLISPSPEGVRFLGGVNDMSAGTTGYFEAELEPGDYALISEVPDASAKNMFLRFSVSGPGDTDL